MEKDERAVGVESERVAKSFVQSGLPPSLGVHLAERPAEPLASEGDGGVHDEEGDLLSWKGGEGVSDE